MGRRRHGHWMEPSAQSAANRTEGSLKDKREAMWEPYVRYESNKDQISISMAGWAMTDQDIESWCHWFTSYLEGIPKSGRHNDELWAHEVNFAENHLTSVGVRCLLDTLTACKVSVLVLKLHHNQLRSGDGVADFIQNSQGCLRELHLSHNELETFAAADIVIAAASARDDHGTFCYPSHAGHSAAPLWLRLEQNYVDAAALSQRTDQQCEHVRAGKVICPVSSRACTPHCCVKHRREPPPVHAKHLSNQRGKPSAAQPEDFLTMLKSGNSEDKKVAEKKQVELVAEKSATVQSPDDTTNEAVVKDGITIADVLRWDEDELRWVRDVIEIPDQDPEAEEDTGRVKLSPEVGDKLGNALKNMIGWSKKPEPKKYVEPEPPRTPERKYAKPKNGFGSPQSPSVKTGSPVSQMGSPGGYFPYYVASQDFYMPPEEYPVRSPASRRSRRGAQPSGSDVKQGLSAQAEEFTPACLRTAAAGFTEPLGTVPPPPPPAQEVPRGNKSSNKIPPADSSAKAKDSVVAPVSAKAVESAPVATANDPMPSAPPVEAVHNTEKRDTANSRHGKDGAGLDENEWSLGKALYSAYAAFTFVGISEEPEKS